MTHNISSILDRAADVIEERGLNKGWYFSDFSQDDQNLSAWEQAAETKGRCCTLGAIYVAVHETVEGPSFSEVDRAASFFADSLPTTPGHWGIPDWNDAPSRRKGQVVNALRRAAEMAREESK